MIEKIQYTFEPIASWIVTVHDDSIETTPNGPGGTVLATLDGRIIGVGGWRMPRADLAEWWREVTRPDAPYVPGFGPSKLATEVAPLFRRQGIGTAIWERVVEFGAECGYECSEYGQLERCPETGVEWWDYISAKYGAKTLASV